MHNHAPFTSKFAECWSEFGSGVVSSRLRSSLIDLQSLGYFPDILNTGLTANRFAGEDFQVWQDVDKARTVRVPAEHRKLLLPM